MVVPVVVIEINGPTRIPAPEATVPVARRAGIIDGYNGVMARTGTGRVRVRVIALAVGASHGASIAIPLGLSNTIFTRETKYMASQEVFFLIDADRISPAVERAVVTNNATRIATMSQDIERGDRLIRSWLEDRGGRVLLFHGDEIYASLPAEHVSDLGDLHEQLQEAWDDSITVGVGLDLNEAKKALDAGKKRGGARIVFYAPEIDSLLHDEESASESHDAKMPSPDPEELKEFSKSNTPSAGMGVHGAKHASLQGDVETGPAPEPPQQLSPYGPPQTSASGETPITPSSTNMAAGLPSAAGPGPSAVAEQFHSAAAGTEAEAARAEAQANAAQPVDEGMEKIKAVIARILQKVKSQAAVLEQLKDQAPEAYQAVVGAIQAMLLMAKALVPQQEQQQEAAAQEAGAEPPKEDGAKEEPAQKSEEPLELAKMAVIHDTHERPMQLWRVQNAAGQGPYGADFNEDEKGLMVNWVNDYIPFGEVPPKYQGISQDRLNAIRAAAHVHRTEDLNRRNPHPMHDFEPDELRHLQQKKGYQFAFTDPSHADTWFGADTMGKLKELGYKVSPVLARKAWRSKSGTQAFYKPWGGWPTQARPEPAVYKSEDWENLSKGEREIRQVRSTVLNDEATPEQLDAALKLILANRNQFKPDVMNDLLAHPKLSAENVKGLLKDAMLEYQKTGHLRDGNEAWQNLERLLNHKSIGITDAFNLANEVEKEIRSPKTRYSSWGDRVTNTPLPKRVVEHLLDTEKPLKEEEFEPFWKLVPNYRYNLLGRSNVPASLVSKASRLPGFQDEVVGHHLLSAEDHARILKSTLKKLKELRKQGVTNMESWQTPAENYYAARKRLKTLLLHRAVSMDEAKKLAAEHLNTPEDKKQIPFTRDADAAHVEAKDPTFRELNVKPGLNKVRQLRDIIEGMGGEAQPNAIGNGRNVLQNIGRLPNGNYSSKKIQEHIDSAPGLRVYATEGSWDGGQQHSDEASKVLRISLPTELTEKLRAQGVNTDMGHTSGHPGDPISGLGWVRWTGDQKGAHIDEIQHDFDLGPQKIIEKTLGHPINRVLHDAFHEWVRSHPQANTVQPEPAPTPRRRRGATPTPPIMPKIGTPVHIWTPESKAPLSGLDEDRPVPGHFQATYRQTPEKMGYQPGTYGTLPTQENKELKGKPTYAEVFRKSVKEIREAALKKSYVMGDPLKPKSTGIDNQIKVHPDTVPSNTGEAPIMAHKTEVEPSEKVPTGSRLSKIRKNAMKKALPMPEEGNKPAPTPSGALAVRMEGDAAPQTHKFRHIQPGEAAHVSMDGKPQGKIAIRQYQSGMTLPNENVGEGQTGIIHPTSALDPQDGRAKQGQQ